MARLGAVDGLERAKIDKVPISVEEDYLLNEIARAHGFAARAKTWRWLLAQYAKIEWVERARAAFEAKKAADAGLSLVLGERI